jgi:hypothetical protein
MPWKPTPKIEIERIESKGIDLELLKRKSRSKSFRGYLNGCVLKAIKSENKELEILFRELLQKFNDFYPQHITRVDIIQGYKDYKEANPYIWRGIREDFYIRIYHREGSECESVKKEHINRMILIIRGLGIGESINCYQIALKMGYGATEKEAWQNLWGRRGTDYFPKYYYVLLILKKLGVIEYSKKGVTRIK